MTIWTHDELNAQLREWKTALLACASGQSYTIGGRSLIRRDTDEIRKMLVFLERELNKLDGIPIGPVFVQGGGTRRG